MISDFFGKKVWCFSILLYVIRTKSRKNPKIRTKSRTKEVGFEDSCI